MRTELLQDKVGIITLEKYIDNVLQIPSSGTITITTSAGADLPVAVSGDVISIDVYGKMSYQVSAMNTAELGTSFIATWTFTIDGTQYTERSFFDVVLNVLYSVISDDDLENELAILRELKYRETGIVTETGTLDNEVIDSKSFQTRQQFYTGGMLKMLSSGNVAKIISYNNETGKFTLSKLLVPAPAVDDNFIVFKSYEGERGRAWDELMDYIRLQGYRPALIIDSMQLRECHIAISIYKILIGLDSDRYDKMREYYASKVSELKSGLKLDYDTDESGTADNPDTMTGQIRFRR